MGRADSINDANDVERPIKVRFEGAELRSSSEPIDLYSEVALKPFEGLSVEMRVPVMPPVVENTKEKYIFVR